MFIHSQKQLSQLFPTQLKNELVGTDIQFIAIDSLQCMQELEVYQLAIFVGLYAASPITDRFALKKQRDWADIAQSNAESKISTNKASLSRSHCRGLCGAAVSDKALLLGFDIEYMDTSRSWADILSRFVDGQDCSIYPIESLCRGWTYLEAYYKAFGTYPNTKDLVETLCENSAQDDKLIPTKSGWRWHQRIYDNFYVSIAGNEPIDSKPIILPTINSLG